MNFFTVYIILKGIYIWLLGNNDTKKNEKGRKEVANFSGRATANKKLPDRVTAAGSLSTKHFCDVYLL